jgi:hypothetical protein
MSYDTLSQRRFWAPSREAGEGDAPVPILQARDALAQFATRQLGLSLPQVPKWSVHVQAMDVKVAGDWLPAGPLAVLDLMQTPPALLAVALEGTRSFTCWIMRARPDAAEPGRPQVWKSAQAVVLSADARQLAAMLDKLLAEGVLEKRAEGIRFTGKRPTFKTFGN